MVLVFIAVMLGVTGFVSVKTQMARGALVVAGTLALLTFGASATQAWFYVAALGVGSAAALDSLNSTKC
jgi:hypothetical protein